MNQRAVLFCSTIFAGLALAGSAFAQTGAGAPTSPGEAPKCDTSSDIHCAPGASGGSLQEVVVTGSRIRQPTTFTSPDPIQVITADEATLRGLNNSAQVIQQLPVAESATQINNNFSGFMVTGGDGVNTINLRGLGADRTLVLLNGQRMGPAGVSGTVGAVDLNTIPETIIDHIDVLKDGSSSIYGSDAVAGVVNIVTKQNFNGEDLHAYVKPLDGGSEYNVSADFGKTFDRGFVSLSIDYYDQEALTLGQRPWLDCAQDFVTDSSGSRLDLPELRGGGYKCWNFPGGYILDAVTGNYYVPRNLATPGAPTGDDFDNLHRVYCTQVRDTLSGPTCTTSAADGPIDIAATRLSRAELPDNNREYLQSTAVSPVKRYTVTNSVGYDIVPDRIQFYNDLMFNRRVSKQRVYGAVEPYVEPGNPGNPLTPLAGITGGILEPVVPYWLNFNQNVDYFRDLAGFRGDLPNIWTLNNLHYDLSLQFSRSTGEESQTIVRFDRVNAASAPGSCDPSYGDDYSYNGGPSMDDLGDSAACMDIDWAADSFNGGLTPAESTYLLGRETDRTLYDQRYIQGDVSGNLFSLPAGPLAFDLGFAVRRDYIHDVPGEYTLAGNSFGLTTAGVTQGSDQVREGFAELSIPALKDLPLIRSLSFTLSGRISDYDSAGTAKTYKASGVWDVTDWLTVKYVQGTSFRAPTLYEQYLANQTSYLGQDIDPCINWGLASNPNIAKNCAAAGIPSDYTAVGSVLIYTGGNSSGNLKPETSLSRTTSIVFKPHWFGLDAALEVDYYENHIRNGIQQFGAQNILSQCYNSPTYPNNGFCQLFDRDNDPTSPTYQNLLDVFDNYVNVADVMNRGIDATLYFRHRLPHDVMLRLDGQFSWTLENSTQLLGSADRIDYTGSLGAPAFVGNVNIRLDWRTWTLNWFVNMVGKSTDFMFGSNTTDPSNGFPNGYRGTGVVGAFPIVAPFYVNNTVSIQKTFPDGLKFTAGIMNVFNVAPPIYSYEGYENVIGSTTLQGTQYDWFGRSVFLQVDKKF
ncbi:MAG: TonB-dependent receptor [Caulobacteraceae bacterium]